MAISAELLRTFLGVGLHLSFSKAAKESGVSQSAISQSVKQLERELDIPLFERTTKSVSFTPAGRELFETVVEAFSLLDNGIVQLQERVNHKFEKLHIAATDTLCRHFLLPYFKSWQEEVPAIGLEITNRPSRNCVEMVESGEAQIAVVHSYEGLAETNHLEVTTLAPVKDIFIGGSRYKRHRKMSLEDLLAEPLLLLPEGASSRRAFDSLVGHRQVTPSFELGSLDVLVDLVEINLGISLVPELIVRDKIKEGRLVEVATDMAVPDRQIVLVRSRLEPLTEGASKFIDLLVK